MSKFGWFITGIGLGTLSGILYAPKSGDETRVQLLSRANEAKEKGTVLADQAVDSAGEYVQRGRETIGQYVEQGKTLANEHLAKASAAVSAAKEAYAQAASQDPLTDAALNLESSSS